MVVIMVVITIIVSKRGEREKLKPKKTSDAHYSCSPLLTNAHTVPEQQLAPPSQLLSVYTLTMAFCSMEYPFGQFGSAVLIVLPPNFLCTCSLEEHGTLKSPSLGVITT